MTGPDSTPDFSWLNKNDEADEAAANAESEPTDAQETEVKSEALEEVISAESEAEEIPEYEETTDDSEAETSWEANVHTEEGNAVDSAVEAAQNPSVFDDPEDDQADRDSDSNSPTMMMPERQLQVDESDQESEFNDEDETMVLNSEDSTPPNADLFANETPESASEEVEASVEEPTLNFTPPVQTEQPEEPQAPPVDQSTQTEKISSNQAATAKTFPKKSTGKDAERSNLKFLLLASYASAITIVALMLMMRGGQSANSKKLESLPDVAPEPADELSYVPVNLALPPGHRLKLGEKQRFGNIEVEPLKVVKEPLEFTHYSGNGDLKRPATAPVYKLWLKFTNVSDSQAIAPLDGTLLLRWVRDSEKQREYANYYIFADGTEDDADVIDVYRHSKTSDWDLQNQQLGHVLEPGESYETYIPSMEGLSEELPENANWRLQFRKGYSPSGNGVTTMIEVAFRRAEIDPSS